MHAIDDRQFAYNSCAKFEKYIRVYGDRKLGTKNNGWSDALSSLPPSLISPPMANAYVCFLFSRFFPGFNTLNFDFILYRPGSNNVSVYFLHHDNSKTIPLNKNLRLGPFSYITGERRAIKVLELQSNDLFRFSLYRYYSSYRIRWRIAESIP